MGDTWRTAAGAAVATPLVDVQNAALVHDYEAEGRLVYLKDLNFDVQGRPVILYLASGGYAPGPASGPRQWFNGRWTGDAWRIRPAFESDHNYDYGPLYVEGDRWQIIAPSEPGPQPWGTGGELALWESDDAGASWRRTRQLTHDSKYNHTYPRRPVDAQREFCALWADGDPLAPSESQLYFSDSAGNVRRLPTTMDGEFATPRLSP